MHMKYIKRLTAIGFLLFLLLFVGYIWLTIYFEKRFLPNTWCNGEYCTGLTVEEANRLLKSQRKNPIILLKDREGNTQLFPLSDIDYNEDYTGSLSRLKKEQKPYLWILAVKHKNDYAVMDEIHYDVEKAKKLWLNSKLLAEENDKEYSVKLIKEDTGYFLYDGLHNRLDKEKAFQYLIDCIDNKKVLAYIDNSFYADIDYDNQQKNIMKLWSKVELYQRASIIYNMGAEEITLSAGELSDFLLRKDGIPAIDSEGYLQIDEEKLSEYIDSLLEEYNTFGKEREFVTTKGDMIQVKGGTYGTLIDRDKELYWLKDALNMIIKENRASVTHDPFYEKEGYVHGKDDIGDTYIEIDMTDQKLYFYREGELFLESDIVTGNLRRKMDTPEGINYIYNKQKNRTLRGPNYASFVKYWMPVKGNIGIHDAGWRDEFGGEIYKTNGSHGCINMPTKNAEILYENTKIGMPVIMYY